MWKYHSSSVDERLHAVADRVLREFLELRRPVRIHAPVRLEESAHPIERLRSAGPFGEKFHPVVQADESRAAFHHLREFLEMPIFHEEMSRPAVAVKDHGVRLGEFLRIWPLGVEMDFRRPRRGAPCARHFASNFTPALCSCSPGACEGRPASSTTTVLPSGVLASAETPPSASKAATRKRREVFMAGREMSGEKDETRCARTRQGAARFPAAPDLRMVRPVAWTQRISRSSPAKASAICARSFSCSTSRRWK